MPRYGLDKLLDDKQINDAAEYVLSLSGKAGDKPRSARGQNIFAEQCASCHGADGKGKPEQGAPNLTDAHLALRRQPGRRSSKASGPDAAA